MNEQRAQAYEELEAKICGTPLVKYTGQVPNEDTIWIKQEFDNPFGSHYDRVYLALFRYHEEAGNIQVGQKILETTSGAAGVSFAGIGKLLGYECFVALPDGGEKARERAILDHLPDSEHLILTPAQDYISGFPRFLKRFLPRHRDYFFLNHSMGPRDNTTVKFTNNEITLSALEGIADETMGEIEVAYFFPAVGNGSSVLGPGRSFYNMAKILQGVIGGLVEEPSSFGRFTSQDINDAFGYVDSVRTRVIPFETFQSAVMYDLRKPGEYERLFGIKPGSLSRHKLPGTSFQGIDFPHIRSSLEMGLVDDVILISDVQMDLEYNQLTGRDDTKQLVHWDTPIENHDNVGRTTRAGINVALNIAKNVKGKNMLVIGYDKAERYDS